MKSTFIAHKNLVINKLISTVITNFDDEEIIHEDINDENIDENESIVDDESIDNDENTVDDG